MRCEVCGKAVSEKTIAEIDGAELIVCSDCAKLGTIIQAPVKPQAFQQQVFRKKLSGQNPVQRIAFDEGLDLKSDFGLLVRKKRQALGITVEELGKKIFEKESVLHKIENQKLMPSDSLIKKLEKELQVSLKEKIE